MKHEKFLHLKPEGGLSLTHGSLFSGIGGFDLAAEWMGWKNIFHCEWNPFGQRVLKHYWPNAKSYNDITKTDFTIHRGTIDILTGGFPCQPYSQAGKRLGKEDDRHLWPEMLRAIREIQPTYVVGENVRGLTNWNGGLVFDEVQSEMEAEGYEVTPFLLPACAVGAPHRRDRIWFIAHSIRERTRQSTRRFNQSRELLQATKWEKDKQFHKSFEPSGVITDTKSRRLEEWKFSSIPEWSNFPTQPPVRLRDDGLSSQLDGITFPKWCHESIKAGGNAIVPQVAFEIFRAVGVLNAKTLHKTSL